MESKTALKNLGICPESLNLIEGVMQSGNDRYAIDESKQEDIFANALRKYPKNTEPEIVAMKIALIDMVNSTNLSRLLGNKSFIRKKNGIERRIERTVFTMPDLVQQIVATPNFDDRVEQGDISLVSELTKWGADRGLNMMSFFSKYCLYHNYCVYHRDDYSIYDSVLQRHIGDHNHLTEAEFEQLFPDQSRRRNQDIKQAVASRIYKMKQACDYESYWQLIDNILKLKGITDDNVKFKRRKFDHYVWYLNRGNNN